MKTNVNVSILKSGLKTAIMEFGTSKTLKYFIGDNELDFDARLDGVVETLVTLIAKANKSAFILNGEIFSLKDYNVTPNMQELINANRVYFAEGTEGVVDPWFTVEASDGKVLSPVKFNNFFTELRSTLDNPDDYVSAGSGVQTGKCAYFNAFEAFLSDGGDFITFQTTATVKDYVAQILNIKLSGFSSKALKCYRTHTERGLGAWVLK